MKKPFIIKNMGTLLYIVILINIIKDIIGTNSLIMEVLKNHFWWDLMLLIIGLLAMFLIGSFILEWLFNDIKDKIN